MWVYRGIRGRGQPPQYLGKYSGRLIVLGGARCVWDDFLEVKAENVTADLMAVNDIGMYCQIRFQHWVSMHADHLQLWRSLLHGHAVDFTGLLHSNKPSQGRWPIFDWGIQNPGAYSGLFAAQVGLCLGYEEIILCGVPQDDSGRFFDPPWIKGLTHGTDETSKKAFRHAVISNPHLQKHVRSISGWTRDLFGKEKTNEVFDGQLHGNI